MKRIDPKYSIRLSTSSDPTSPDLQIVNLTGVAIPDDEPLILFRARDRHALAMLLHYRELCVLDGCTDFHMKGIDNRIIAFQNFAREHPDRMKQPGVTRGK